MPGVWHEPALLQRRRKLVSLPADRHSPSSPSPHGLRVSRYFRRQTPAPGTELDDSTATPDGGTTAEAFSEPQDDVPRQGFAGPNSVVEACREGRGAVVGTRVRFFRSSGPECCIRDERAHQQP